MLMNHQSHYQPSNGLPPSAFQHAPGLYAEDFQATTPSTQWPIAGEAQEAARSQWTTYPTPADNTHHTYCGSFDLSYVPQPSVPGSPRSASTQNQSTPALNSIYRENTVTPDRLQQLWFIKAMLDEMQDELVVAIDIDVFRQQAELLVQWIYRSPAVISAPEQLLVVDTVERLLNTFIDGVSLKVIPEWAVSLHQSPSEHPEPSKLVHKAVHAVCIAYRHLISESRFSHRIALIVERYRARRPFRINAHAGHGVMSFGQLDFAYQLPRLEIPHPSSLDAALAELVGKYRTSLQIESRSLGR
ncbi:hypothetical protein HWV62_19187 [Athelia sp. TMB]|nr:hypothetical protein HWV62_19187 [Athelia sp. TMB]